MSVAILFGSPRTGAHCRSTVILTSRRDAGAFFKVGCQTDLLYLAGLAALVLGGSGPFALDQLVRRPRLRRTETTL
jgi:putative oxidoreductase